MSRTSTKNIKRALGFGKHPGKFSKEQRMLYRRTKQQYNTISSAKRNKKDFLDSVALVAHLGEIAINNNYLWENHLKVSLGVAII